MAARGNNKDAEQITGQTSFAGSIMSNIGFGLERLGLLALQRPLATGILALLVTLVFGFFITTVKFNGSVTAVIPRTSEVFLEYEKHKSDFRDFSRDIAVIARSDALETAQGLETLRELQIELSLIEGVSGAFSMFSMPGTEQVDGELVRFFPNEITTDEEAREILERLVNTYPQAASLVSTQENAVLMLVTLDVDAPGGNLEETYAVFEQFVAEAEELKPEGMELLYSGLTPIGTTILNTLIEDQVRLTLFGLLIGAGIALAFFRCTGSAFLCGIPPTLTAIWSIGLFGVLEVPITYITTILPTLALILAYADGIVLHHRWSRFNREREKNYETYRENLREAVLKVGPATALTSITTAIALSSFMLSSSESLFEFGWLGLILVSFAFLSVVLVMPIMGLYFAKRGWLRTNTKPVGSDFLGKLAHSIYSPFALGLSVAGFLLVGFMIYSHLKLEPEYRITDYLPQQSSTLEAERIANDVFGGRSLMFFAIPAAEEGGVASSINRERIGEVSGVLISRFGTERVFSMDTYLERFSPEEQSRIGNRLQNASAEVRQAYISRDDQKLLVSLRVSSDQSISETAVLLNELKLDLSVLEYADDIIITGFPVLISLEFSQLIEELRTNLLIAIFIGIVLIGIATRSVFFALAAAIPNMVPVLFVQSVIFLGGGHINITEVVALTLAFGIAIDNAVHVINVVVSERNKGEGDLATNLKKAVYEVGPALAGSTLVICAATATALTSQLPILNVIGELIIIILIAALATNLILLPAYILTLGRLTGR